MLLSVNGKSENNEADNTLRIGITLASHRHIQTPHEKHTPPQLPSISSPALLVSHIIASMSNGWTYHDNNVRGNYGHDIRHCCSSRPFLKLNRRTPLVYLGVLRRLRDQIIIFGTKLNLKPRQHAQHLPSTPSTLPP